MAPGSAAQTCQAPSSATGGSSPRIRMRPHRGDQFDGHQHPGRARSPRRAGRRPAARRWRPARHRGTASTVCAAAGTAAARTAPSAARRRVLQHHDPGGRGRSAGQEKPRLGCGVHRRHPGSVGRLRGGLAGSSGSVSSASRFTDPTAARASPERRAVQRGRQVHGMEAAVVHHRRRRPGDDQRVLQTGRGQRRDDLAQRGCRRRPRRPGSAAPSAGRTDPAAGPAAGIRRRAGAVPAATRCGPGNGPAASGCSAPGEPSLARKVNAVTTVAAASTVSRSITASAARPMDRAFEDISASASPGSSAPGGRLDAEPGQRRDVTGAQRIEPADRSASGLRSAVRPAPTPLPGPARCGRPRSARCRTAVIALTWSGGSGGPAVVAWLRSSGSPGPASSFAAQPSPGSGLTRCAVSQRLVDAARRRRWTARTPARRRPAPAPPRALPPAAGSTAGGQRDRLAAPGDQHDLLAGQGSATQFDHHASVADHRRSRRTQGAHRVGQ